MVDPANRVIRFIPQDQIRTVQPQNNNGVDGLEENLFTSFADAIKFASRTNSNQRQDSFSRHEDNNV